MEDNNRKQDSELLSNLITVALIFSVAIPSFLAVVVIFEVTLFDFHTFVWLFFVSTIICLLIFLSIGCFVHATSPFNLYPILLNNKFTKPLFKIIDTYIKEMKGYGRSPIIIFMGTLLLTILSSFVVYYIVFG